MELIQTLKKLFGILLLMFLFLENIVYAQDGELNMKTDSITQRKQHSSGNEIEHQYAPNLFIDRTEQQATKEKLDVKKLVASANMINFNKNGVQNSNKDIMQVYQRVLFQNYNAKVVNGALQKRYNVDKNFYLDLYNHSATALYFEKAILKAINDAVDQKSVKQALAMQVMHTFSKRAELPLDYTNQVNSTMASISVRAGDYTALFNKLKAMGALSDEQINSYNTKLNLLEKYASAKGATTGTIQSYSFINVENDNLPSTLQYQKRLRWIRFIQR